MIISILQLSVYEFLPQTFSFSNLKRWIVEEMQLVVAMLHMHNILSVQHIIRHNAVNNFLHPQTALVVNELCVHVGTLHSRKLLSLLLKKERVYLLHNAIAILNDILRRMKVDGYYWIRTFCVSLLR